LGAFFVILSLSKDILSLSKGGRNPSSLAATPQSGKVRTRLGAFFVILSLSKG
jgi:hypothetical protein